MSNENDETGKASRKRRSGRKKGEASSRGRTVARKRKKRKGNVNRKATKLHLDDLDLQKLAMQIKSGVSFSFVTPSPSTLKKESLRRLCRLLDEKTTGTVEVLLERLSLVTIRCSSTM